MAGLDMVFFVCGQYLEQTNGLMVHETGVVPSRHRQPASRAGIFLEDLLEEVFDRLEWLGHSVFDDIVGRWETAATTETG